jgi:hypothetical protein
MSLQAEKTSPHINSEKGATLVPDCCSFMCPDVLMLRRLHRDRNPNQEMAINKCKL